MTLILFWHGNWLEAPYWTHRPQTGKSPTGRIVELLVIPASMKSRVNSYSQISHLPQIYRGCFKCRNALTPRLERSSSFNMDHRPSMLLDGQWQLVIEAGVADLHCSIFGGTFGFGQTTDIQFSDECPGTGPLEYASLYGDTSGPSWAEICPPTPWFSPWQPDWERPSLSSDSACRYFLTSCSNFLKCEPVKTITQHYLSMS